MSKTERSAVVLEVMEALRKVPQFERLALMHEVADALACEFLESSSKPLIAQVDKMGVRSAAEAVIMTSIAVADVMDAVDRPTGPGDVRSRAPREKRRVSNG
jgi:hypothetical protein